jgi:hypothetical protein
LTKDNADSLFGLQGTELLNLLKVVDGAEYNDEFPLTDEKEGQGGE